MKKILPKIFVLFVLMNLILASCARKPKVENDQPYRIKGSYTVTNDFVFTRYAYENAVDLIDMHGFVVRDRQWELPVRSQVLGFMSWDAEKKGGDYQLSLPAHPEGEFNDVDNNGHEDAGVQIFTVAYSVNIAGGPFSEGDDRSQGWPAYLATVVTDSENNDEVIGGKLVVWAADDKQMFPTGFGDDALLFTKDDPAASIPAGYTIVDLDKKPFEFSRDAETVIELKEPKDIATKDFSKLSYTEAFKQTVDFLKTNYAFNGIQGKQPDWDKVYAAISPRVAEAEKNKDATAFYLALRDFTLTFKDSHVGLTGGDIGTNELMKATSGGYGFAVRELDDGRVMVIYILDGGPAQEAGMQVGAVVTEFNGKPISEAMSEVRPLAVQSSDYGNRYQKARYLLATAPGTETQVTFVNPGGETKSVSLTAIAERNSFSRTSIFYGADTTSLLPVDYKIITQGNSTVGYVRVNSYADDLNLTYRLFERALKQFTAKQVKGLIIDLRYNGGGSPLGLAGFFYDKEIVMGQAEEFSEKTGKFELQGLPDRVLPNVVQYKFDKMALLVWQACASACDEEAYSLSQVPGMLVVGQSPTNGAFADVARGQFDLPEGFSMQAPTTRFVLPDGGLFLEGQGVAPTVKVPVDAESALATNDVVLDAAIQAVLLPVGAGIKPSGAPKIAATADSEKALTSGTPFLDEKAQEKYKPEELGKPGVFTYTVPLTSTDKVVWGYFWCASTKEVLAENFKHISLSFELDGQSVPQDQFAVVELPNQGQFCHLVIASLSDWPAGEHHLTSQATFDASINDGFSDYAAGNYISAYSVFVKP